jgi:two-component system, OmpR family, response regulator CpxR
MCTVLVVDDDADNRDTLAEVLTDEGHSVRTTSNGADALALIQSGFHPDVVLLDLVMPGMSGDELITRLRSTDAAEIPILVLSAKQDWQPPEGVRCLRKPIELGRILEAMRAYGPPPSAA